MSPSTARIMPTIFQTRCSISLFDAQYSDGTKRPIPSATIDRVIAALTSFKRNCADFGVLPHKVRIIATEATRVAINSTEFREAIEQATGWAVEMLPKEDEGRIGALGVASSFHEMAGLALDLGGGSVQISWVVVKSGVVETSAEGAVSLPYGAAAVTRLLLEAEREVKTMPKTEARTARKNDLETSMIEDWKAALSKLQPPLETKDENGYRLYLSGGGFRGWGYLLMNAHAVQPYPVPIINGFESPGSSFAPEALFSTGPGRAAISNSIFGISSRRASQLPAVELLITSLLKVLGPISTIHFAQGGVREGIHFATLPVSIRQEHPLVVATKPHAQGSAKSTADLVRLIEQAIPQRAHQKIPSFVQAPYHLIALVNLLGYHASVPKDVRASAALRCTTSGLLAGAHGISHADRGILALALLHRWGGELAPADERFMRALEQLVGGPVSWWCRYLGIMAGWIGDRYPTGVVPDDDVALYLDLKKDFKTDSKMDSKTTRYPYRDTGVGTTTARTVDSSTHRRAPEANIMILKTTHSPDLDAINIILQRNNGGADSSADVEDHEKDWKQRMIKLGRATNWGWGLTDTQRWGLRVAFVDE